MLDDAFEIYASIFGLAGVQVIALLLFCSFARQTMGVMRVLADRVRALEQKGRVGQHQC